MPRVRGLPEPRLDGLIGEVEALVLRALRAVGRAAARLLGSGGPPSADDLAVVPVVWGHYVDTVFVPVIGQVWSESSGHLAAQLVEVGYEDGSALTPSASDYLAVARNRLRDVGDEVWETLRDDLAEGVAAGEGVEELARRIEASAGVGQARAERIARTEVIAASNAASLAVANLTNLPGMSKEWLATPDTRTRAAHRLADGQRVPLGDVFEVGGSALRFPGDPDGPADLTINCRCSLAYQFGDDDMTDPLTAAAEVHTGAMVALIPSEADAARLAVEGGEPVDELHTTLLYLGDAADYPEGARAQIISRLHGLVDDAIRPDYTMPVVAEGFAVSLFNPPGMERADGKDRDSCIVLGLGGEDLSAVRGLVVETVREVEAEPAGFVLPEQHDPWTPHITLIYTEDVERAATLTDRVGPVVFDRIRVAFAGENTDIPLAPVEDLAVEAAEGDGDAADDWDEYFSSRIAEFLQSDRELRNYWLRGEGAAKIRWGTKGDFTRCVRQLRRYVRDPEGLCNEYHFEANGFYPGDRRNQDAVHPDVAPPALADETTLIEEVDVVEPVADEVDPLATQPGEHWHAFANIEEISTGMRMFSEGALTWRNLPFAFHWQYESSAHGGHPKTAHIGLVTRVERVGPEIHVWGALDLGSERGREYGRRLVEKWERWVSIGLDESFRESDIEYLYPETFDPAVDDPMDVEAEEMVIHAGRIGEVTGVSVPAQQEATIEATPELIEAMAALVAATRPHDEAQHPRGGGGKWVRKGAGDGVTTDVPTSDGGHVAVDADDDGRVGVGVDSESGRSTATLAPQSAADLAEVMRGGLDDGEEVIVEDGESRVSLSRDGDVYQLDVGADSTAMAEADLPAVADTISEAVDGSVDDVQDMPDAGAPLEEASAADMDLALYDDGSVDVEWEDGGFNIAADEVAPLAEAFAAIVATPEEEWPTTRTAGAFTVSVDEAGDVELSWGDGAAAFDLDETDALASALRQLSARWDEEITGEVEIDMEEPMAASAATRDEGRRRLASAVVRRTRRSTVIVAAGHTITIPTLPPPHWFTEPTDVTPLGALTVTDEGRVYGFLAPAKIAHRAFRDRRQEVPMGRVDYGRWMGGEALVAGGRAVAGPITMNCGHMSPTASADSSVRMEHYDNTCSIVAQAAIGENANGVWIAGALLPGVTAEQVTRMMACRLSGDWAPHPERPGWMEFVAALLVPVPGFPMARSGPSVRIADGALVAAAVPVRMADTASPAEPEATPIPAADLAPVMERLARTVGMDFASRMARLRDRVGVTNRP